MKTLRTERLTLRPATAADVDAIWRFRQLESVNYWLTTAPQSFDEFRDPFTSAAWLANTLVIECNGEMIGDLMLKINDPWAQTEVREKARNLQAELGWVLHPDYVGRGFATEAVHELIRHCFEDLGLRRVTAECFEANDASRRLMERVGMRREAHSVRDGLHRSGEWMDGLVYALLADEWNASS